MNASFLWIRLYVLMRMAKWTKDGEGRQAQKQRSEDMKPLPPIKRIKASYTNWNKKWNRKMILNLNSQNGGGGHTGWREEDWAGRRVRGKCIVWRVRVGKSSVCHNFQFSFCRSLVEITWYIRRVSLLTCCYCLLPVFFLPVVVRVLPSSTVFFFSSYLFHMWHSWHKRVSTEWVELVFRLFMYLSRFR